MARTIKNDNVITINRTIVNEDLTTTTEDIDIGRYYFEASRDLKNVVFQIYFDKPLINDDEKEQVAEIYKTEYLNFCKDVGIYGWETILDITK